MSRVKKTINPFYILLVLVGFAFVVTACAYGMMAYRDVTAADGVGSAGLLHLMNAHGGTILAVEVVLLGLFTVGAIGTDEFWQRRQAATNAEPSRNRTTSSDQSAEA